MTSVLTELNDEFAVDEFSYEPRVYLEHLDRALRLPDPIESVGDYVELLENILTMLHLCDGVHLSDAQRAALLGILQKVWSPDLPEHQVASITVIASLLLPMPEARAWLMAEAARCTGNVSEALRTTGLQARTDYVV